MAGYIDKEDLKFLEIPIAPVLQGEQVHYEKGFLKEWLENVPTADVVEREKIDKAIEEIEQTLYVDSLIFGELIDFKDGKISADDVIEEFNRVARKEVLEIIKRNVGE